MALHVVGVRHHSPACARLVAATIRRLAPRYVLIEGPSDMNERLGEMALPHELPVALFTYRQGADGGSHGVWSPFCAYSPEWVALETAREVGATALFIDLPAWAPAFAREENRYSDRHVRAGARMATLCAKLGFEDSDALWDHLFEQPAADETLARALAVYFEALRGDEPGDECDGPREATMGRYIAWAMADAGERDVVVVCGGYHKPALERGWAEDAHGSIERPVVERPVVAPPEPGVRVGSYLIPFSFGRLDSFAGYASGMPSPRFYETVWQKGPAEAGEAMLFMAVRHLRRRGQAVSPADAIAAATLAKGLALVRGHVALARCDVLDGLAGALVKEALDVPLPWTRRGPLSARTPPFLAELIHAFAGDTHGKLAAGTPQPPLLADVEQELARVGLVVTRDVKVVRLAVSTEGGHAQSVVLHRLAILGIPGFTLARGVSLARNKTDLTEAWSLARVRGADTALIEAALHGATLESAVVAKLEEQARSGDVVKLADLLVSAVRAGIRGLTERGLAQLADVASRERSFGNMGLALERLLSIDAGLVFKGPVSEGREEREPAAARSASPWAEALATVLDACFDRALWLCEGVQGPEQAFEETQVRAMRAMRDRVRRMTSEGDARPEDALALSRARALCRRRARDGQAPPALRGAALGFLWSVPADDAAEADALVRVLKSVARPQTCGDFLAGLFALAREEVQGVSDLLAAIDTLVTELGREDFLVALPSLRQAFSFFPPRERLTLAEGVLALRAEPGAQPLDPLVLVGRQVDEGGVLRAAALERAALALARRFGLTDEHDGDPR